MKERDNRIVNLRNGNYPDAIYIGRPGVWGNPFSKKAHPNEDVIALYEQYVRNNPDLIEKLHELKDESLACWCYPKRCHGDVLLKLLKEYGIEPEWKIRSQIETNLF